MATYTHLGCRVESIVVVEGASPNSPGVVKEETITLSFEPPTFSDKLKHGWPFKLELERPAPGKLWAHGLREGERG